MAKRPSYRSIRVRQRNIVEGMATGNLSYAETARRLGVTQSELKRFIQQKPRAIHQNYNRSETYSKLYEKSQRAPLGKTLGLKRGITPYEFREEVIMDPAYYIQSREGKVMRTPQGRAVDFYVGREIGFLYYKNGVDRYRWSLYAKDHHIPISINALTVLYKNKRISSGEYARHVEFWAETYNPSSLTYNKYADLVYGTPF